MVLVTIGLMSLCVNASATFHGDVQRTGNYSDVNGSDLIWKTKIGGLVDSSPVVEDGRVYVVSWYAWTGTSKLSCLHAKNGTEIWNVTFQSASTPVIYNGKLILGGLDGKLYCFNSSNGEEVWNVTLEEKPGWYGITSSPLVYNDTIYVTTFSKGVLWALDLNGNVKWNVTTGGETCSYSSPSVYNHTILFAGNRSGVHEIVCVNESGKILWEFKTDGKVMSSIAVGYGKAYFTTQNRLYALDLKNHVEAWNRSLNGTISTPALAYGKVFVGTKDGKFYCFNSSNGEEIWNFTSNGMIYSSPAVGGDLVYFATNVAEGTIYALNVTDGSLVWKYKLTPPEGCYYNIMSSPTIWGGKLFIGADDGNLYCFGNFSTIWDGKVTLVDENVTITLKDGNQTEIRAITPLYALLKASMNNFSVNVTKTQYGLYVESIAGINAQGWCGWSYWVNYPNEEMPMVGSDSYYLKDGDTVIWYYGCWNRSNTPADSDHVIKIKVGIEKPIRVRDVSVKSSTLGGNVTAFVNVSSLSSGWYVLVVSGLNGNGDYIAGISTFEIDSGETLRIPILIHIPQRNTVGTYNLYAGLYRLENYPNDLIDWFGPIACEVTG